jgi:hypothetical protein
MLRGMIGLLDDSSITKGEQVPEEHEITFAELLFRVEIDLWQMFAEIESDFQKIVDDAKAEFKRIHREFYKNTGESDVRDP